MVGCDGWVEDDGLVGVVVLVPQLAVQSDARIMPCYVSGSGRPKRWLLRRDRVRIAFGEVRTWRELAGEQDPEPGRALYYRIGEAVMRDIAQLKQELRESASRGAA